MDLHHNIFYSYRGVNSVGVDRDGQLENNLTKALINTLCHGGKSIWQPFLANLGIRNVSDPKFLLQRRDLPSRGAAAKQKRVLLGISRKKSTWSPAPHRRPAYESLPDGWVYDDSFAVLVESKVNEAGFLPDQMEAHRTRLWPREGTPPQVILKTWEDVHRLFLGIQKTLVGSTSSQLLVAQFVQYLEYSDMTGFTGFRPDHFAYFILHDDDDARRWILNQVDHFAAKVLRKLTKISSSCRRFYKDYDVGTLSASDDYCWVAFGPADNQYRPVTHQTVFLGADGVGVAVNTELKTATDQLKTVLKTAPSQFRSALQEHHDPDDPFDLVIVERVQERPYVIEYYPLMTLNSWMLADENTADVAWNAFSETIQRVRLPYLKIKRLIPQTELVELSERDPEAAIDRVVVCLAQNHELVEILNGEKT